jgi:uncharacterized membrane protein YbaN (DUF454 family)
MYDEAYLASVKRWHDKKSVPANSFWKQYKPEILVCVVVTMLTGIMLMYPQPTKVIIIERVITYHATFEVRKEMMVNTVNFNQSF